MKKVTILVAAALAVTSLSANAQKAYEGTRFLDNWYVGVKGGVTTPTAHSAFWRNMRAETGIELGKQITPVLGVSFEGLTGINTSMSKTAFDDLNLGLLGKINLNNLFCGYNGQPRLFEVEGIAGFGWGHDFMNSGYGYDRSYMVSRFGASLNFNLGEQKAWTVNVRPAIVYRMDGNRAQLLNVNKSKIEILAGVTYHFASSNGKHYMTIQKPYNQAEVDALNESVNALRAENARKEEALNAKAAENARLAKELTDLKNAPKQVETIVQNTHSKSLESVVTFRQGKTAISADQIPNVERIATYMKNNPKSTVSIKGYASPEGSAEVNARVANQRAEAVKNMLISKYKISASRITAEGQGVGDMFSEPDWNRVSIATLNEAE
ncbi:MAG TPA: OmpA family protein [Bacteroides mediterraneensis]|uniref:OmpA family protein n=1 Tax=Bacteroides mediterraneensis TaxID=1841856 RepID=UPI002614B332|nr:OmpA family protein [Bacteroides mediterraneensis]HJH63253.1 OmpA family protein [Bacteroides mediterraneensis]